MRSFSNVAESCSFHHLVCYQSQSRDFHFIALNIDFVLSSQYRFRGYLQFTRCINFYFYSPHLFYFKSNQTLSTSLISNLKSLFVSFNLYSFGVRNFYFSIILQTIMGSLIHLNWKIDYTKLYYTYFWNFMKEYLWFVMEFSLFLLLNSFKNCCTGFCLYFIAVSLNQFAGLSLVKCLLVLIGYFPCCTECSLSKYSVICSIFVYFYYL